MQQCRHRDMRVGRHGVAQRERAIGRELHHQAVGQRLDAVLFFVLRLRLAANRDNSPSGR